jgi:hypothetical protein
MADWPVHLLLLYGPTQRTASNYQRLSIRLGHRPPKRPQSNGSSRVPQSPILSDAARYGVRRPDPVPVPQGMHRARRTQQKRGGEWRGRPISSTINFNLTVAYLAAEVIRA